MTQAPAKNTGSGARDVFVRRRSVEDRKPDEPVSTVDMGNVGLIRKQR